MRPTITKQNIQIFFSTLRTVAQAEKHFGFDPDKREDLTKALRFKELFYRLRDKGILKAFENAQFLTVKGEYVGYNQRALAEAGCS